VSSNSPAVIAIGASAGGVEALTAFAAHLPREFPHAILVALHMPADGNSALASILGRSGLLPAVTAETGSRLQPGVIYVARPDRHLLIEDGTIHLSDGPTESGHRPSINALFRSVALHSGSRGVGVLMSGVGDDGVDGLAAIAERDGVTIAQHPDDAVYPTLPCHAIDTMDVGHILPVAKIGPFLAGLDFPEPLEISTGPPGVEPAGTTQIVPGVEPAGTTRFGPSRIEVEEEIAKSSQFERYPTADDLGPPSGYVCPDCGGALLAIDDKNNYRCHIGHAWSGAALLEAQSAQVDHALSVALRSLHERINLATSLAKRTKPGALQDKYRRNADEAREAADTLSSALSKQPFRPSDN
jgi:two-component system, chemotaxis family, protein-glutamate methylesterase/glutaminase